MSAAVLAGAACAVEGFNAVYDDYVPYERV